MTTYATSVVPARETVDKVQASFLDWLAAEDTTRQRRYRTYREYYDGDHDTQLSKRQRRYLQIKMGEEFNANYCQIVVDALAERLEVTGFEAGGQSQIIWDWWKQARMDGVQGIVHLAAVRDGDAYVMVEWDNEEERLRFSYELGYDGTEGVKIHYDPERRRVPLFASKRWRVEQGPDAGKVRRLNLYHPNRIEKYVSREDEFEGNWQRYEEGDEGWPLWWTRDGAEGGEPLGVPVVHFRNKDEGYNYGQSELRNVVPLQNALNKSIIDLLAAADTTAFRIYWMIGDDPSSLELSAGTWVYTKRPPGGDNGAAVGFFPGEDLDPMIRLVDSFELRIAKVTRTPISYFQISRQRAAEGTLKQEEAGLVAKAKDRHVSFGNAWEDAIQVARRIWNTFGEGPELDEEQTVETLWADAETRNEKEHLEALAVKREKLGVPQEQIWLEAGYGPEQVEKMKGSDEVQGRQAMMDLARRGLGVGESGD